MTYPGYINAEHSGEGPQPTGSTTSNGAANPSDRNSLSVGPNGPLLLHDVSLIEALASFDREKVPERLPHAKGSGAFGTFETTEDVTAYTKAGIFQPGASSEVITRFSTVAGEQGSPDTWRDVRGFSVRFYTDEGNLDLVGNNTPIFFVRDPMKFPNFIRSQRRTPDSGLRDPNMQWDFWTAHPESAHQVSYLMGDRGLPKTWRQMNGYSSHTYMWVNGSGERFWVKYHWHSDQGVENLSNEEAEQLAGADADYHRRDLFDAIERGDHPSWTLSVQVMPYEDAKTYRYNPFDLTKVWPHSDYPLIKVGRMTLNRNPENWFAQIEQVAFSPSNQVPGTGVSPDKMLLARVFSYPDAQRHRIGANFTHLPVNQPKVQVNAYQFDGPMAYLHSGSQPTYVGNAYGRPWSDETGPVENGWEADGELVRQAYDLREDDGDFVQPGMLVREVYDDAQRERLAQTVGGMMGVCDPQVRERVYEYWRNIDQAVGERIEQIALEAQDGPDAAERELLREEEGDLIGGRR
ncbi:Catalase [Serinicoccus hydrothermalis]|uniref:Catalase n=1 Tax=Serinicoccus hydrothermalis TaxID=1758689 RepID=A0A1B1N7Y4_9MICO|nr:catalase [Serinicoccus hydrothermalis]ANS77539.1 Catalase [Serinicoccus hydrothermalis]